VRGSEGPQDRTYSPRLERGTAFLTLCAQGTSTTVADARGIQDPQGAIPLNADGGRRACGRMGCDH